MLKAALKEAPTAAAVALLTVISTLGSVETPMTQAPDSAQASDPTVTSFLALGLVAKLSRRIGA